MSSGVFLGAGAGASKQTEKELPKVVKLSASEPMAETSPHKTAIAKLDRIIHAYKLSIGRADANNHVVLNFLNQSPCEWGDKVRHLCKVVASAPMVPKNQLAEEKGAPIDLTGEEMSEEEYEIIFANLAAGNQPKQTRRKARQRPTGEQTVYAYPNENTARAIKAFLDRNGKHDSKLIDLGCGSGLWLDFFAGLGFDAVGHDIKGEIHQWCGQVELDKKIQLHDSPNLSYLIDEGREGNVLFLCWPPREEGESKSGHRNLMAFMALNFFLKGAKEARIPAHVIYVGEFINVEGNIGCTAGERFFDFVKKNFTQTPIICNGPEVNSKDPYSVDGLFLLTSK